MTKQSVSFAETLWLKETGTLDSPYVQKSQYRTKGSTAAGDDDSDLTIPDTKLRHSVKWKWVMKVSYRLKNLYHSVKTTFRFTW
jgi:hypothetical protein